TQYAGVLIWRGSWADAEAELGAASRDFELSRPPLAVQALARLGELRRRQGRMEEAAKLFEQAESQPVARLGQAALALDRGAPDGAARARLDLVDALVAVGGGSESGQRAAAEREARRAFQTFQGLGAERDANRAKAWLARLSAAPRARGKGELTRRQLEILRFIAQGLSNPEIAARLSLSDHTVKRHV